MLESSKSSPKPTPSKKLGQMLIERGAITGEQLLRAIDSQRSVGGRIGTCLLEMEVLSEDILLETLAEQLSVPALPAVYLVSIDDETLQLVPSQVAKRCQAIPFAAEEGEVQVAILDVRDLGCLDELAFCTSRRVHPHIANEARIFQALERHYGHACPSRYVHLVDRLEGQSYQWQEGALVAEGPKALSTSWQANGGSTRPAAQPSSATQPSMPRAALSPPPAADLTPKVQGPTFATPSFDDQPEAVVPAEGKAPPKTTYEPLIARQPEAPSEIPTSPLQAILGEATGPPPAEQDTASAEGSPWSAAVPAADGIAMADRMVSAPRPPSPFDDIERLLSRQSDRDVIGQILLRTLSVAFRRCALFKVHRRVLRGWLSRGQGFDHQLFLDLELSLEDSSIFRHLQQGSEIYIGPLPHSPAHRRMACTWGGDLPKDCLMMPIRVRDHMVCVVYVDNGTAGLHQPDVDGLRNLVHRASLAFEWCIMRKKSLQQDERGR